MDNHVLLRLTKADTYDEAEFFLRRFMQINNIENGQVIDDKDYFKRTTELLNQEINVFTIPLGLYAQNKTKYSSEKNIDFGNGFTYINGQKPKQKFIEIKGQVTREKPKNANFINYLFSQPLAFLKSKNDYAYAIKPSDDLWVYYQYINKDQKKLATIKNELMIIDKQKEKHKKSLKPISKIKKYCKKIYNIIRVKKGKLYLNMSIKNNLYLLGYSKDVKSNSKLYLGSKIAPEKQKSYHNFYYLKFDYHKLDEQNGVAYPLVAQVDQELKALNNSKFDQFKNFNNVKAVYQSDKYIYYTRNTFSGNILVQKKLRYYFEDKLFNLRVLMGFLLAKQDDTNIIFFEKNISKFDESAKQVYEQLNVDNKYIALMKSAPNYEELAQKYGQAIIEPGTVRYYQKLFGAKYVCGTEIPAHLATLRSANKLLRKSLQAKKLIFLQHGVMMAISLNADERKFFRRDGYYNLDKIVVSSQAEKEHFIELGNYQAQNIWCTGLANFDGNNLIQKPKKYITIMHTWRPFEQANLDIKQSTYYQNVMDLYNEASKLYEQDLIKIIWHPKMSEYMTINQEESIKEILEQTKVLITDYSSIAFDAFYRGANVMFDWRYKQENLMKAKSQLIYNENMAFGDVFTDITEFSELLQANYTEQQSQKNQAKYQFFNEFSDNQNTKRICKQIEQLFEK